MGGKARLGHLLTLTNAHRPTHTQMSSDYDYSDDEADYEYSDDDGDLMDTQEDGLSLCLWVIILYILT